jgi:transcriptional regulator with XRE-family HTH domain
MRLSMTEADPADDIFDIDSAVGARLRARRLDLGMTEWDLGYEMGASGGQVLAWETGQMQMSASELWLAAQALDVPLAWFFEDLDGATPEEGVAELSLRKMLTRLPRQLKAALLELVQSVAGEPGRSATLH